MFTVFHTILAALPLSLALPLTVAATTPLSDDKVTAAILQQLQRYERALNASDIDSVITLYAEDGVFMPQHSPPAVGRDAVRAAYRRVFDMIKLDIRFQIDEIRPLSGDWAYARTRSAGTVKLLASDQPPGPEANQELFLLHRETNGEWRIARYIFSTTNPPKQP
jgi:uncharacterized protein (TIGR02246 family)